MHINPVIAVLNVRDSYWFIPTVLVALALVAGVVMPLIDAVLGDGWLAEATPLLPAEPASARATLTTLAGAVIGVAGVAFSVTIVAVSFASSNFGPRLIGNFMSDRVNQVVLGVFLSTFVYCVMVLRAVQGADAEAAGFVPQLAILFAMVLALSCVAGLIVFIHHVPESINVMNLVSDIGLRLRGDIGALFEKVEEEDREAHVEPLSERQEGSASGQEPCAHAPVSGYLQYVDLAAIRSCAHKVGAQITVLRRPGDFVVKGEPVMAANGGIAFDEATREALRNALTFGRLRTDVQDTLYLSDQLVEIVGRALSPSLNDPHTAILCLDWLRAGLSAFAEGPSITATSGRDPVRYRRITFTDMTKRSFGRMRPYIAADRTVTLHALVVLADIAVTARTAERAGVAVGEMDALARSGREMMKESAAHEEIAAVYEAELARVRERWGAAIDAQRD